MARNTGITVYLRNDGQWANKANDELRATGLHIGQDAACEEATAMLAAAGGGNLTIKDKDGQILSRLNVDATSVDAAS